MHISKEAHAYYECNGIYIYIYISKQKLELEWIWIGIAFEAWNWIFTIVFFLALFT